MNIDAVVVANYFYRMSDGAFEALHKAYADPETLPLAQYINEIPPTVLSAMKRILEVE